MSPTFQIAWIDAHREPKEPPNPHYPNGIDLDMSKGKEPFCRVELPYPAPRVGAFRVSCEHCGLCVAVTTAGRVDDPRSVKLACDVRGRYLQ